MHSTEPEAVNDRAWTMYGAHICNEAPTSRKSTASPGDSGRPDPAPKSSAT
ncbi:hypothetical protein ACGFT2_06280 [Streptomyces sp. NPDC048514]|uniref:hypothetical protein n=1 Tax=Streptomyces sp. NPDC048514 TaxID=3365564 RepID=UPI0037176EE3